MDNKAYVCYCGLYCKLCPIIAAIPPQARALFATMEKSGYGEWGEYAHEGFKRFWTILQKLAKQDETCTLCQGECGNPECKIRVCARERGVLVCAFCDDYPCTLVDEFAKIYAEAPVNNDRIREIGLDAWIVEQEELVAQGRYYWDGK
ncbi:MAG: DUF3795 domain-containing protein [Candidatus Cloacimonetes bacterium]|nr:DUF3795 domain-containing protein [Candidatus Cloacimonadota bacterium]